MFDRSKIQLARKPQKYDHRDFRLADYITAAMRRKARSIRKMEWPIGRILDQGDTPHCVGYAWAGFGISLPVADDWDAQMGEHIYYQAKVEDGEPNQENGSTTRSGVEAFMHFGALQDNAYAFATSLDDILVWLSVNGPVVTGTNWYDAMFEPDAEGIVHIDGRVAGGHEWLISGVDKERGLLHCTNSWGDGFGIHGQFYITFEDYLRLFNEEGDAVTTLEIVGVPTPPDPTPAPGCVLGTLRWLLQKLEGKR